MKAFRYFLVAGILLASTGMKAQTTDDRGYLVKVGQQVPEITIPLTDGKVYKTSDLKGKVVMLQFTASWCGVCRKEMPFIEKDIWQKYKDKGLVLIGIDRGEPADKVKAFAKEMKITYPLALDENSGLFTTFADTKAGVTRNILIDKTGKIVFLTRLYDTVEFEGLKQKIAELMTN